MIETKDVPPKWLWLSMPLAVILLLYAISALAPQVYLQWIIPEDGVIESATPVILLVAIAINLRTIRRLSIPRPRWLRVWLIVFTLGCLYVAGEEVSWGQRIFGWATPESWTDLNKQKETNIHNVSAIFDSKPRLLLSVAVLLGGIVYPLSAKSRTLFNRILPPVLWPARSCTPSAIIALTAGWPEKITRAFTASPPSWIILPEPGEMKEFYLAVVLMLYASTLSVRLRGSVDAV